MATTTPNFGWPVPTSTDLVKDGAVAIEGLGDAIDASLLDLKGGTTGQVLSKTTNTDMDFSWITPSAGSSGSSNVAGKNVVLNSNFSVWQRGTSFSVAASSFGYYADRWMCDTGTNQASTFSRQLTGDTTNLPNIQYCLRFQRNSGQTGTGVQALITSLETVNSIPLAGKTVTLSFYARAGANYSAASNALVFRLLTGTGTDQNALTVGYTGQANTINETATLTTTWQRFTATAIVPSTTTEAAVYFRYTPTGTAGANDYYEVTGVQLEIASSASAYSPNAATFQGELAACQRYYWRKTSSTEGRFGFGSATDATQGWVTIRNPITMRANPTSIEFSGVTVSDGVSYTLSVTAIANTNPTPIDSFISYTCATGQTARYPAHLNFVNGSGGYFGVNAEL